MIGSYTRLENFKQPSDIRWSLKNIKIKYMVNKELLVSFMLKNDIFNGKLSL
jgi:hypothetical protein